MLSWTRGAIYGASITFELMRRTTTGIRPDFNDHLEEMEFYSHFLLVRIEKDDMTWLELRFE